MNLAHARTIANEILGHLAILGLTTGAAFLANHYGIRIPLPAFAAGTTLTSLLVSARLALRFLVKGFQSGKLEAVLVAEAKKVLPQVVSDVVKQAEKSA